MDWNGFDLGPKMLACSEKERLFVWYHVTDDEENATEAARKAGYVDNDNGAIRVAAHRLMHRERVAEAIGEVSRKLFRAQLPTAVRANRKLLLKDSHPDHARTVQSTLSRLGLSERTGLDVNLNGEVTVNHTDEALNDLRTLLSLSVPEDKLIEIFGFSGLSRYRKMLEEVDRRAPKVIEHQDG